MDDSFYIDLTEDLERFTMEKIRVYLAGPLTNTNAEEAHLCRLIRHAATRVLGPLFEVYDPGDFTPPGSEHCSEEVYTTDHSRTSTADWVLFHVNAPSLGVGIESQIAAEATIPRVVAYRKGAAVSRMFDGVFSPTIATIEYESDRDFAAQLEKLIPRIMNAVKRSADKRRPIIERIEAGRIGREIFKARVLKNMLLKDLATNTDIRKFLLRRLERNEELVGCLTLVQLTRIAEELDCDFVFGGRNSTPSLSGPGGPADGQSDVERESLNSLHSFVVSNVEWIRDDVVFAMWAYYQTLRTKTETGALAARHRSDRPESEDGWKATYDWIMKKETENADSLMNDNDADENGDSQSFKLEGE